MEDKFFVDYITHIERKIAKNFDTDSFIDKFYDLKEYGT